MLQQQQTSDLDLVALPLSLSNQVNEQENAFLHKDLSNLTATDIKRTLIQSQRNTPGASFKDFSAPYSPALK